MGYPKKHRGRRKIGSKRRRNRRKKKKNKLLFSSFYPASAKNSYTKIITFIENTSLPR